MEYTSHRSRSQTRNFPDSGLMEFRDQRDSRDFEVYSGPNGERTHRSKSLDYRRTGGGLTDEDDYERSRRKNYYPERNSRQDFDSPRRHYDSYFDQPRGTFGRTREMAKSQEWTPSQHNRWQPPSPNQLRHKWYLTSQGRSEFGNNRQISPKSVNSGKRLNISTSSKRNEGVGRSLFNFGRKKDDHSPRSGTYPPTKDEFFGRDQRYRYDSPPQGNELIPYNVPIGSDGYSRHHQSSYHHESRSNSAIHGGQSGLQGYSVGTSPYPTNPRKPQVIQSQPQPMGQPTSKYMGQGMYSQQQQQQQQQQQPQQHSGASFYKSGPPPQRQHYRVHCCCFTFTWPPWSYEPTEPPHPIYRNI